MRQRNLHSATISTTMYEKNDPWRRRSTKNLRANGKKWYSVIKLTTPFVQSYMVMTVSLESTAVASANGARIKSIDERRSALKNITMTEHKTVFPVKKNFRNPVKTWNTLCVVSQKTITRKRERDLEEPELILRV